MDSGLVQLVFQFGVPVVLLVLGYLAGSAAERAHLTSLRGREEALAAILVTDLRSFPGGRGGDPTLVAGEAVIATDYFKTFLAKLKNLLGGEVRSYQSLVDRARREAMVRMLEQARRAGYDGVCNVRLDWADIGKTTIVTVGIIATGTAYKRAA